MAEQFSSVKIVLNECHAMVINGIIEQNKFLSIYAGTTLLWKKC